MFRRGKILVCADKKEHGTNMYSLSDHHRPFGLEP
jgi:hypothetical protein